MMTVSQIAFKLVDVLMYDMQNGVKFQNIECIKDVVYREGGTRNNSGDIYFDKNMAANGKKFPVIVNIHGGGFVMGDKDYRWSLCEYYAHNGYFVYDINYRMPPEVVFPEICNDCADAINFLPELAKQYNIDLDKIIVTGDSSGGYLTSYIACMAYNEELREAIGGHELNVKLAAIAPFCGIYDVKTLLDVWMPFDLIQDTASMLLGMRIKHDKSNFGEYKYIDYLSPYDHINDKWCPVFIAWTDSDLVCIKQGEKMAKKLEETCKTVKTYHCDGLLNNHCYHLNYRTKEAKKCMAAFMKFLKENGLY